MNLDEFVPSARGKVLVYGAPKTGKTALVVYGPKDKLQNTQEAVKFAEAAIGSMILHSCAVSMRVLNEPQELKTGVLIYPVVAVVPFLSLPSDDETAH